MGSTSNPNWTIMMTQVTVEGQNNTIGGIGSKGVVAEVKFADTNSLSNPVPTDLRIDIASPHGLAWKSYFNRTLAAAGMVVNTDYTLSYTLVNFPSDHTKNYYIVTIIIKNVGTLDHTRATVTLSIGELGII
jgi:hypothetical protein